MKIQTKNEVIISPSDIVYLVKKNQIVEVNFIKHLKEILESKNESIAMYSGFGCDTKYAYYFFNLTDNLRIIGKSNQEFDYNYFITKEAAEKYLGIEQNFTIPKIAKKLYQDNWPLILVLYYITNWSDSFEEQLETFKILTKEELEFINSEHFNTEELINEYCKLIHNVEIKNLLTENLIPKGIKLAIKEVEKDRHNLLGACFNWYSELVFEHSYDYLVNLYINEGNKLEKLNNICLYIYKYENK